MNKIRIVLPMLVLILFAVVLVQAQETTEIAIGGAVTGTLSSENRSDTYTFTGQAGDTVTIVLTSDDFDTFLVLMDSQGQELANDDDSAGNLNSQIGPFDLPADGMYTILADSARHHQNSDVFSSGLYSLTLAGEGQPPIATGTPDSEINIGDTVTGNLTDATPSVEYTFSGRAGTSVTITLSSNDFDAFLVLLDANRNELASDDDSGGDLNSQIGPFELPQSGIYTVVADSTRHHGNPEQVSIGLYSLQIAEGAGFVSGGESITIGGSLDSSLNSDYPTRRFAFTAQAGDMVVISITAPDFDGYLTLQDTRGVEIAYDDDSGGELNPRIGPIQIAESGTYTIVVTSYDYEVDNTVISGDFHLSLTAPEVEQLEYGGQVEGQISAMEPSALYLFNGQAGDAVLITMDSPDFYGYLELASTQSPSNILASGSYYYDYDTDASGLRLGPIELPETGSYSISIHDSEAYETIGYTLRLEQVQMAEITYNTALDVQIGDQSKPVYISFEGEAGQAIDITVDSGGTVDTTLTVFDPDSYEITSDDDSGAGFDPEINRLVLTTSGTYHILLETYGSGVQGTVSVLVVPVELPSLDNGPQVIRLDEKRSSDAVTFMGHAGEKVQLSISVTGQAGISSPYINVTQAGEYVTYADVSDVSGMSIEFIVPYDGVVNVAIEDYSSYNGVTLEVTLTRVPNA